VRAIIRKVLRTCGLVILTGPLCFLAAAQYVDLEAERAAAQAAGQSSAGSSASGTDSATTNTTSPSPTDPYGAQPAQAYPATSYGVNNAPAAPSGVTPVASSGATAGTAPAAGGQMAGSELGNLFLQVQQLQQEVMRLNGVVEEQAHEMNTLKEQSLQRYMDLDKRLGAGGQSTQDSGAAGNPSTSVNMSPPVSRPVSGTSSPSGVEQPGEAGAYNAAYTLVERRQFDQAIPAFQQFLQSYPDGKFAANALYWLGELYLVKQPPDLEASRQSFALLLKEYPSNSKAPDALYKLGKVQFLKGNSEKAREYLDLVIREYKDTNPSVVNLAKDFIAQNPELRRVD
jgi:tol-pal system protein YbgF